MLRVTYLSRESKPLTSKALVDLLEQCKHNNPSLGVTGMLLYANGTFLQMLEGETNTVETLLEKIARDRRHRDFQVMLKTSRATPFIPLGSPDS
jgi:hypothetical protein